MPQIRCPNCGMTINLENRKAIDFNLITDAAKKKPRTFTELLHITKLPRKTLSLRLKELCKVGALVKNQHMYEINGLSVFKSGRADSIRRFPRVFRNEKVKTGFMLIVLLICFSTSGYVLARLFTPQSPKEENQLPVIMGKFEMDLNINNVYDLYDWQVVIIYNQSQLEVDKITPGDFLEEGFPFFLNSTDSFEDLLLLGGCMKGEAGHAGSGKSGSGKLATITFGYFIDDYDLPKIVPQKIFKTLLSDSQDQPILISDSTLTLTVVENQ